MILVAALKVILDDNEVIVPCWRHGWGYSILHDLGVKKLKREQIVDGFINHKGEFLDRAEAYEHAMTCGQLSAETRHVKQQRREQVLYSEDLY